MITLTSSMIPSRFQNLRNKRVVVLGASGFIGSHLVDSLLSYGCHVTAVARKLPGMISIASQSHPLLNYCSANLCDRNVLDSIFNDIDIVVHLASGTLPKSSNDSPESDVQINLLGSLNVLESAVKNKVSKVVFLSSGGTVYGNPVCTPIDETHPTNPICSYGINKLAIEKYCFLYQQLYGLDTIILRLANPYGERQRLDLGQGVVPAFLGRALRNQPLEIWGDGSTIRDFLYISDVVDAISLACLYKANGSQNLFNIGSGKGVSLNELIFLIEKVVDKKLDIVYKSSRSFDVPSNILSISKAQEHLAWCPQVSNEDGLKRFFNYLKSS